MKYLIASLFLLSAIAHAEDLAPLKTAEVTLPVVTDADGMTLYYFDLDTPGVSHCTGGCAIVWPPALAPTGPVNSPLSVVVRSDGTHQIAFNGRPLYHYAGDTGPGETNGNGVQNIWHLVIP